MTDERQMRKINFRRKLKLVLLPLKVAEQILINLPVGVIEAAFDLWELFET